MAMIARSTAERRTKRCGLTKTRAEIIDVLLRSLPAFSARRAWHCMPNSVRSKQTCVASRSPATRTPNYGSILPLRRKFEDYNRVEFIPALLRNFQKQASGNGRDFGLLAALQKMSGSDRS